MWDWRSDADPARLEPSEGQEEPVLMNLSPWSLVVGPALVAAVVTALVLTARDRRMSTAEKLVWVLLLVLVPVLGLVAWLAVRLARGLRTQS
jgi:L-asparagine transporter-like permease